jgi:hypothetical protein
VIAQASEQGDIRPLVSRLSAPSTSDETSAEPCDLRVNHRSTELQPVRHAFEHSPGLLISGILPKPAEVPRAFA